MGNACAACFKPHPSPSPSSSSPPRPFNGRGRTENMRAKDEEARTMAALAAEERARKFEQSAVGRAAKASVKAAAAKPSSLPIGEPTLKWQMGG